MLARTTLCALVLAALWWAPQVEAQAINVETRALATREDIDELTDGFKLAASAGGFFWTPEDHGGFSLQADIFYNIPLGPVVLAPGARLAGYIATDFVGLSGFATFSAGLRLGPVLPFLVGGVGFGLIGGDGDEEGLAYLGGGGVMLALKRRLALGVEADYQGVHFTDFRATYIAARINYSY